MSNTNELNYQPLQQSPDPNYASVPNIIPNDGSISSRLASTGMVRLRIEERCACNKSCSEPCLVVNTISRIDDKNRDNENELPLFEVKNFIPACCPLPAQIELLDSNSKLPYSKTFYTGFPKKIYRCCSESYYQFPDMNHFKYSNINDIFVTRCYDSRSFYRTFEYQGQQYYKIGNEFIPNDQCCDCCGCCKVETVEIKKEPCCSCCKSRVYDKRTYINICNMLGQVVGQCVRYFNESGCCCCQSATFFYEIYFPKDANELAKLALIGQLVFIIDFDLNQFNILPLTQGNTGVVLKDM